MFLSIAKIYQIVNPIQIGNLGDMNDAEFYLGTGFLYQLFIEFISTKPIYYEPNIKIKLEYLKPTIRFVA